MNLVPELIEVLQPEPGCCPRTPSLPPEGNVKLRNYRVVTEHVRVYSPTGDVNTTPVKGKLVARYDVSSTLSPPRARILDLLRPEDPGRDALEAIVRPASRRGLTRPLDEDTRRFLQRALLSPSPHGFSAPVTPEKKIQRSTRSNIPGERPTELLEQVYNTKPSPRKEWSLADELQEAEENERSGKIKKESLLHLKLQGRESGEAVERERMGKLALSVEEDETEYEEEELEGASRRLDALLAESRDLHVELAAIQRDLQKQCQRAGRCAAAARRLLAEARALHFLDDVVALLRGDVACAVTARGWPFALGARRPGRNYIV